MKFPKLAAQLAVESVNMNRIIEKINRRVLEFRPFFLKIYELCKTGEQDRKLAVFYK